MEVPYFDNFEKTILTYYAKLNPQLDYHLVEGKSLRLQPNKKLKFTASSEEKQICIKIFDLFQSTIQSKIIKNIPEKPIFREDEPVRKHRKMNKVLGGT